MVGSGLKERHPLLPGRDPDASRAVRRSCQSQGSSLPSPTPCASCSVTRRRSCLSASVSTAVQWRSRCPTGVSLGGWCRACFSPARGRETWGPRHSPAQGPSSVVSAVILSQEAGSRFGSHWALCPAGNITFSTGSAPLSWPSQEHPATQLGLRAHLCKEEGKLSSPGSRPHCTERKVC